MNDEQEMIFDVYKEMCHQFDPGLSLREETQNMQDAQSSRLEIIVGSINHDKKNIVPFIIYRDNGHGMTWETIKKHYLQIFSSTKTESFYEIGKYGVGVVSKFGLPWDSILVTTTPQFGDPDGIELLSKHGYFDSNTSDLPHYRLVFTEKDGNLPTIEPYLMEEKDLSAKECVGTHVLQVLKPIPKAQFSDFVKKRLETLLKWVDKIPTSLYFGVANGWQFQLEGKEGDEYSYYTVTGNEPDFFKMNIIPDAKSSLDKVVSNFIDPFFPGITSESSALLKEYGISSEPTFSPAMIAENPSGYDRLKLDKILDALEAMRIRRKIGDTDIIVALNFEQHPLEVRNRGILLSDSNDLSAPELCAVYIDSPFIRHDIARSSIVTIGPEGRPYREIRKEVESMQYELYSKFIKAVSKSLLPIECDAVKQALFGVYEYCLTNVYSGLKKKILYNSRSESWLAQNRSDLILKNLEKMIGKDAIEFQVFKSADGVENYSLTDLIRCVNKFGQYFYAGYSKDRKLLSVLRKENIPVLAKSFPILPGSDYSKVESSFLLVEPQYSKEALKFCSGLSEVSETNHRYGLIFPANYDKNAVRKLRPEIRYGNDSTQIYKLPVQKHRNAFGNQLYYADPTEEYLVPIYDSNPKKNRNLDLLVHMDYINDHQRVLGKVTFLDKIRKHFLEVT